MKKMALHWQIIIGLSLGIVWAVLSAVLGLSEFTINWISPFGDIFINLLKLIAVPLVLFSIISGVTGLSDIKSLGRLGAKTLSAYLITTVFAVSMGLLLVNMITPGERVGDEQRLSNRIRYEMWAQKSGTPVKDRQIYSTQLSEEERTRYAQELEQMAESDFVSEKMDQAKGQKGKGPLTFLVDMVPSNIFLSLNNNSLMLQVIFFALFFGITILFLPPEIAKPTIDLVNSINAVFLKMVDIVMKGAPFFVFALLAGTISKMAGDNLGSIVEIFKGLAWYSLTVVIGLGIMIFVVYPGILMSVVRKLKYTSIFRRLGAAQMLAFSTSSSAATLPVTLECVTDNMGVDSKVTSFVLPIGATVNMDGTSLYQAVAVVFLAQFHMVDLTLAQQLVIILTATLASIGSAAVPSAGLVMLIIVLESVGLNPAWIAIIFPVDRILDMCRTVVNVTGDAAVSTIIAKSEGALNLPE
jgi:Na+/H+-dicarboxylate symporter